MGSVYKEYVDEYIEDPKLFRERYIGIFNIFEFVQKYLNGNKTRTEILKFARTVSLNDKNYFIEALKRLHGTIDSEEVGKTIASIKQNIVASAFLSQTGGNVEAAAQLMAKQFF